MKKLIYITLTTLICFGCASKYQNSVYGTYTGHTQRMGSFVPPGEMTLSLKSDKIFNLNWLDIDYSGIWETLDENHILLKFDEITDVSIQLRSGVILDNERIVKFNSKNKITMLPSKYVLKRMK